MRKSLSVCLYAANCNPVPLHRGACCLTVTPPHVAVSADKLHGRGGIVHLALQSTGQKPNDRHVILVTHEDSGVAVWNFRCRFALSLHHVGASKLFITGVLDARDDAHLP